MNLSKDELNKLAQRIAGKMKEENARLNKFWESPLCKKMIEDLKNTKEQLDSENFAYFPEKTKKVFGWNDLSDDEIKTFIKVMESEVIGNPEVVDGVTDLGFGEKTLKKDGLEVVTIIGQGAITFIRALSK